MESTSGVSRVHRQTGPSLSARRALEVADVVRRHDIGSSGRPKGDSRGPLEP